MALRWVAGRWTRFGLLLLALAIVPVAGAGAQEDGFAGDLRPSVPGCPICDLWSRHQEVVLSANQEVGSLENGVIYFLHAQNPSVIEPLIRFAYERAELEGALARDPSLRAHLGEACEHVRLGEGSVQLEISTGAHGFFALLTSPDEDIVAGLQEEASLAILGRIVRF